MSGATPEYAAGHRRTSFEPGAASGLSPSRLGRMHEVMAGHVGRGEAPGLVALVSRHGEVYADALGFKALDGREPMGRDTIFRISSMTKPITAAATMVLVEECALRLDEPVDRLLPELAGRRVLRRLDGPLDDAVPAERPITVRDLLTFRMGMGMILAPPGAYPIQQAVADAIGAPGAPSPASPPPPDEWMRRLGTLPLVHQPGERWMYNTGAEVLGVLIARAAGQPFETFLRERIFEPLGMKDTAFAVPANKLDRLATSYLTDFETGSLVPYDDPSDSQWGRAPAFPDGAAGLVSTADDCLAFGRMMLGKGRTGDTRILARASVETMTMDHLTPEQKAKSSLAPGFFDGHGWGFGMAVVTRRDEIWTVPGSFGWDGGLGTSWWVDPREDMITILMTQAAWTSSSPPDVNRDFWTLAYQAIDD